MLPQASLTNRGNIRERSLIDIWNAPNSFSYNRNFSKENLNGECKNCRYGKRCRGGCLTVSTSLTGEKHSDPYCMRLIEKNMIAE